MSVILYGATGMAGAGALLESLAGPGDSAPMIARRAESCSRGHGRRAHGPVATTASTSRRRTATLPASVPD